MKKNDDNVALGDYLRQLRGDALPGRSLRSVAAALEISPTYLSAIETGRNGSPPSDDLLVRLADLYSVDRDELALRAGRIRDDLAGELLRRPILVRLLRAAAGVSDRAVQAAHDQLLLMR